MKITAEAAAKINLSLDITGRLPNGYHDLFMIMQSVSLYDTVTAESTDSGSIEITCSEPSLPTDKSNIAWKAASVFFDETGIKNKGIKIHLEKRIPFAAGLAGGSADAAGVIAAMDSLYGTGLCASSLCAIGAKVGSDVPFCLTGGTKLVEGAGEKITPMPAFGGCAVLLAKPDEGVSTAKAYGDYDGKSGIIHPDNAKMLHAVMTKDFEGICTFSANVFEQVVHLDSIENIKAAMNECGASLSRMSGSGPTVFGLFADEDDARRAEEKLKSEGICRNVFLCAPASQGVIIKNQEK